MNTSEHSILRDLSVMKANNPRETFQIIDKIGEGTYGCVYKAINKITDQLVAIKICPINEDEQVFYNELEALSTIQHPFIVRLFEAYNANDELWLVLEYCQMGSIADLLKITQEPFTEPEIAAVCYNLLLATSYLHMTSRIHRDIKPANILINHIGQVKLTDFGITTAKTYTNTFVGSPLWMAPEQAQRKEYTQKVDVWAIGVCVIQMAELYTQFEHLRYPSRVIQAIQSRPQVAFRNSEKFSPELNSFLAQCLQIEPEKRATAAELIKHTFIEQHRPRFTEIRKKFYTDKMRVVKDSRLKQVLQKEQNKGYPNFLEDMTVTEKENSSLELNNTRHKSAVSNDTMTMIERSSIHSSIHSSQDCAARGQKSQLYLAIKNLQNERKNDKRVTNSGSNSLVSMQQKGNSSSSQNNRSSGQNKKDSSQNNSSGSQQLIHNVGSGSNANLNISSNNQNSSSGNNRGQFKETTSSVIKISSILNSSNFSLSSGPGIPQQCKENLAKHEHERPFFGINRKSVSPMPTYEAEESQKSGNTSLNMSTEKRSNSRPRRKVEIGRIDLSKLPHGKRQLKTPGKNYKKINVSNFIVGKGRRPPSYAPTELTSDSDISPCSIDWTPSRNHTSRAHSRKPSSRQGTSRRNSARKKSSRRTSLHEIPKIQLQLSSPQADKKQFFTPVLPCWKSDEEGIEEGKNTNSQTNATTRLVQREKELAARKVSSFDTKPAYSILRHQNESALPSSSPSNMSSTRFTGRTTHLSNYKTPGSHRNFSFNNSFGNYSLSQHTQERERSNHNMTMLSTNGNGGGIYNRIDTFGRLTIDSKSGMTSTDRKGPDEFKAPEFEVRTTSRRALFLNESEKSNRLTKYDELDGAEEEQTFRHNQF